VAVFLDFINLNCSWKFTNLNVPTYTSLRDNFVSPCFVPHNMQKGGKEESVESKNICGKMVCLREQQSFYRGCRSEELVFDLAIITRVPDCIT
jgi:hypothetical protein